MKFIKTHLASILIIVLLLIVCFILNKRNKELKVELKTVNEELQISLQRSSSLIIRFKFDFDEYDLLLRKLIADFKFYTDSEFQKEFAPQERCLSNQLIFKSLMNLRDQLKGFKYMIKFPEYNEHESLYSQFLKIRKLETDLAHLINKDAENLIGRDSYIWGQDTLIAVKFNELKVEAEKFYNVIDSIY